VTYRSSSTRRRKRISAVSRRIPEIGPGRDQGAWQGSPQAQASRWKGNSSRTGRPGGRLPDRLRNSGDQVIVYVVRVLDRKEIYRILAVCSARSADGVTEDSTGRLLPEEHTLTLMDITCGDCGTRFRLDVALLQGRRGANPLPQVRRSDRSECP